MLKRHMRMLAVVTTLVCATLQASENPTYTAIRGARPDGRTITLTNYVLDRDAYHFVLTGKLHLLAPIGGSRDFGAVFIGQGSYELTPASVDERRMLSLYSGDPKLTSLTDQFDRAVFFDSDLIKTARAHLTLETGTPDREAVNAFDDYLKKQRKDFSTNIHARILQEVLNGDDPIFFSFLKGKKYPPAILAVDPRGAESLRLGGSMLGSDQTILRVIDRQKGGIWYLSHLRSEVDKGSALALTALARAESYSIDARVTGKNELSGTTTITFSSLTPAIRVLPIQLAPKLRLSEVAYAPADPAAEWTAVAFVQESAEEDAEVAVILPAPLTVGSSYRLRLTYAGKDVLTDAGDGNFSVGARQSWYPNLGTFTDMAKFELTYRVPQKYQVVSVGSLVSEKVEGDQRVSVWKSERPLRVAGFNYGKFKKLSMTDKDSGFLVDVYTNPGTPDVVREINMALESASGAGTGDFLSTESAGNGYTGPSHIHVDTASLAQAAIADGVNTARTASAFFGALPDKHVAFTQQSVWSFGQSWPSLIYLPYLAVLDGTTRNTLGLNGASDFVDQVGPHEFAHQWWGHDVGWRSYHDQWLSEGFAEFTAALVLQQAKGWPKYNAFWEKKRRFILERPRGAFVNNDAAGPIAAGWRVSSWQNESAYEAMTYAKGAYVLQMLRMAMQDRSQQNSDAPFTAMMTDFAQTYAGKNATTADFQRVAEKHIIPMMNVTRDGRLDWFFQQWIYDTTIPKLTSTLTATAIGGGKYHIAGNIGQEQVTEHFVSLVPVYVVFGSGAMARIASVPVMGNQSKPLAFDLALPQAPKSVGINLMHDVLSR